MTAHWDTFGKNQIDQSVTKFLEQKIDVRIPRNLIKFSGKC